MLEADLEPKRMAISARRTGPLHESGYQEIRDKVDQKLMSDPTLCGFFADYNRIACWGSGNGSHNNAPFGYTLPGLGLIGGPDVSKDLARDNPAGVSPTPHIPRHPKLSECLTLPDKAAHPEKHTLRSIIHHPDLTRYTYTTRTEDKILWPRPNPKAISSRKCLAEMMMGRHAAGLLAKQGIIPVVVSPNPRDPTQSVRCPFGPMLDSNRYPYKVGTRFPASTIYNRYRLKKGKGFNDAWNQDIWAANACVFRLPEKNGLPVDVPIISGLSPLGEVLRVLGNQPRLGFIFYGSGGVPVVNGFVSPSANSKAATDATGGRDGATFEAPQTVANKANFTMDQLCERGTPVPMFATGKAFPVRFYDPDLSATEQGILVGMYRIEQQAQQDALEKEQINEMVDFYNEYYELDSCMLRFHLEYRKKYKAVPVEYPPREYFFLEVDKRDDRTPLLSVDEGCSYQALLSTEAPNFISGKEMITNWIDEGGHLELADFPYHPIGDTTVHPPPSIAPHPLRSATAEPRALPKDGPRQT
jgi:hypothetical protein